MPEHRNDADLVYEVEVDSKETFIKQSICQLELMYKGITWAGKVWESKGMSMNKHV